ncbi:hypothetical protein F2B00_00290 [Streptomyces parvus]|uniref:hypothetical protein n=1 Tax=Streptomyces parvus TaxID=66428 RepID=UPI00123A8C5F|nr:hypothetical protein [Streptomyces parvus]KAA6204273.1 hypothetical protein F2B00_00290 [Streptomyces parvus]GGS27897.1 hypothetical protein GCM10010221_26960 [Streptomyces parvus]
MSDLEKAARDAVDAQANSEQVALILAVLQAQQLAQGGAPSAYPAPPAVRPARSAAKWIGIGIGGSVFLIAFALSAVAVAISAVALTVCVLVLRSVWQDVQRGR